MITCLLHSITIINYEINVRMSIFLTSGTTHKVRMHKLLFLLPLFPCTLFELGFVQVLRNAKVAYMADFSKAISAYILFP